MSRARDIANLQSSKITADSGIDIDNITLEDNTISTTNSNGNLTVAPNGTGDIYLSTDKTIVLAAEGESATLMLVSDESDDNGDDWSFIANTDNTLTIGNDASGSNVAHVTITPNATVANSTANFAGKVGVGGTPDQKMHLYTSAGTTLYKAEVNANSTIGLEIKKTGSTTQTWRIVDGETVNGALQFYDVTDSRLCMQINGDGNVGVGVSPSGARLHVDTAVAGYAGKFVNDNTATDANGILIQAGSASTEYALNVASTDGNTTFLSVKGNGKVGIGTNSPSRNLTVSSSSQTDLAIVAGTSSSAQLCFGDSGDDNIGQIEYNNSSNYMAFYANTAEVFRINTDGNFGIGNAIPSSSYKFQAQSTANQIVQLCYNSNASFTQDVHNWDTIRAATDAFNFFRARTNVGGSPDSEMILQGNGNFAIDGTVTENGADYAEYFEWKDGNSDSEDRVGITVKLDGDKIVPSTSDDTASVIIGVISGKPSVVGDSAWNKWKNKHETDDYGRYVWEEYTFTEWTIPATETEDAVNHIYPTDYIPSDLTVPSDATVVSKDEDGNKLMRRKLNSSYNPSTTYIPREQRPEWDAVGMMGKLRIRKGQTVGDRWIKMRDVSSSVEEWLVK